MNERLKKIRKGLGLTQREFGRRLGVQDTAISKIEKGENGLTEQMILAICREFNVNEDWLRTGNGEMEKQTDISNISSLVTELGLDELARTILSTYAGLSNSQRDNVKAFIQKLSQAVMKNQITQARREILHDANYSSGNEQELRDNILTTFFNEFQYIDFPDKDEEEFLDIEAIADRNAEITCEQTILEHKSKGKLLPSGSTKEV